MRRALFKGKAENDHALMYVMTGEELDELNYEDDVVNLLELGLSNEKIELTRTLKDTGAKSISSGLSICLSDSVVEMFRKTRSFTLPTGFASKSGPMRFGFVLAESDAQADAIIREMMANGARFFTN